MTHDRAWILLPSGGRLNLLNPDPWAWTDRDLTIGLSRTYRWGGHSCWDLPLSVAQHSLLVLVLRQKIAPIDKLSVVFAVFFAIAFLGERLTWKIGLGTCLIAAGAVLMLL